MQSERGRGECGFIKSRGCIDQVFVVRQVCENYLANVKYVFFGVNGF